MAKLIELKEAAEKLGITPEALTEMVDQKKIFGYRDGSSWKFKPTELERVAGDLGTNLASGAGGLLGGAVDAVKDKASDAVGGVQEVLGFAKKDDDDDLIDVGELQLDDDADDGADSILISEEELGRSEDSTSSTIIGKAGLNADAGDSDINIAAEEETMPMPDTGSDLALADGDDDELTLAGDSDLGLASDDLSLKDDSDLKVSTGDDSALKLAGDSDLNLESESSSTSDVLAGDSDLLAVDDGGTGALAASGSGIDLALDDGGKGAGSSLALAGSDALSLDDDELSLDGSGTGSAIAADSALDLDLDDDDLLAGSGMGSDITLGASDSGINLSNPSDSGISLEDVGSGIDGGLDSSLELGDDDMIELEADPADPEESTDLQADDEFMLTPVAGDGDLDEESDDSGSQVIALDSDEFDESAATMLVADDDGGMGDGDLMDDVGVGAGALAVGGAAVAATGAAVATSKAMAEEADFSVWNIVSLIMLATFMGFASWIAMDVLRNISSWNEPYGITNSLTNLITGM